MTTCVTLILKRIQGDGRKYSTADRKHDENTWSLKLNKNDISDLLNEQDISKHFYYIDDGCITSWASCQIRKIAGCACGGNAGNVFPPTTGLQSRHASRHVCDSLLWCMLRSLTRGFLWCQWLAKGSRHSRSMHKPQFCASGKRPIERSMNIRSLPKHAGEMITLLKLP